jgi:hypothetical protein
MSLSRRDLLLTAAAPRWNTSIHGAFELTSTPETFHMKEFVRATEDDKTVFERHWDHAIKRDLM